MKTLDQQASEYFDELAEPLADSRGLVETTYVVAYEQAIQDLMQGVDRATTVKAVVFDRKTWKWRVDFVLPNMESNFFQDFRAMIDFLYNG